MYFHAILCHLAQEYVATESAQSEFALQTVFVGIFFLFFLCSCWEQHSYRAQVMCFLLCRLMVSMEAMFIYYFLVFFFFLMLLPRFNVVANDEQKKKRFCGGTCFFYESHKKVYSTIQMHGICCWAHWAKELFSKWSTVRTISTNGTSDRSWNENFAMHNLIMVLTRVRKKTKEEWTHVWSVPKMSAE